MPSVYLVYSGTYEDRDVEAVFATLADAQAMAHADHAPAWEGEEGHWYCVWYRQDHRSRVPVTDFDVVEVPVIDGVATLPDGRTVKTKGTSVRVASIPKDALLTTMRDWTTYCDYSIREFELR